ncbi:MAG: Crp/Fnr family transcriptional regulator [Burkholderiales bacterium]|jgi:CRP/FNR family cyclic AMP-dependent transcriptional regulator|nr:Crp/Fnr family transcriptional regulator [Burkholderiales bacterium]MBP7519819.1 Crp/Fnr family transcriptional regulator [Leptothrix sp. (in: b-proteobacteria)]
MNLARSSRSGASPSLRNCIEQSIWGRGLTSSELALVLDTASEQVVPAAGWVVQLGDPAEHWLGVVSGLLKMTVGDPGGRLSTLTGAAQGAWFGEGSLLRHEGFRYSVQALRATRVARVPRSTFEALRHRSLPFNHYLQHLMNARLGLFIGLLQTDRLLPADARVARCLASLYNTELYPDPGPCLNLSQAEVALLAGMSRQRTNAALQRLALAGLIELGTRRIMVIDLAGLRAWG